MTSRQNNAVPQPHPHICQTGKGWRLSKGTVPSRWPGRRGCLMSDPYGELCERQGGKAACPSLSCHFEIPCGGFLWEVDAPTMSARASVFPDAEVWDGMGFVRAEPERLD